MCLHLRRYARSGILGVLQVRLRYPRSQALRLQAPTTTQRTTGEKGRLSRLWRGVRRRRIVG